MATRGDDFAEPRRLNQMHLSSDENKDVATYETFLAPEFMDASVCRSSQ